MKTNEQLRTDVVNYLTKVSKHVYIKPNVNDEDFTYFKVIKDDNFKILKFNHIKKEYFIHNLDIEFFIKNWSDPKTVISDTLFANKKMIAIKNNSKFRKLLSEIKNDL